MAKKEKDAEQDSRIKKLEALAKDNAQRIDHNIRRELARHPYRDMVIIGAIGIGLGFMIGRKIGRCD